MCLESSEKLRNVEIFTNERKYKFTRQFSFVTKINKFFVMQFFGVFSSPDTPTTKQKILTAFITYFKGRSQKAYKCELFVSFVLPP